MEDFDRKAHWENIYTTKELTAVSWYQSVPVTSLEFLVQSGLPKTAKIIDVGGGDSFFADHLLEQGYTDITVLDISEQALERAKKRLGEKAARVKWIVSDASTFVPQETYDFWHDRDVFHFLTAEKDILSYTEVLAKGIRSGGILVIGTFSETGPLKCSGIPIKQYSENSLAECFAPVFDNITCVRVDHPTPFDTVQNFVFCSFRRR